MCDIFDLGKLLSQNEKEEKNNNNTQDDTALPEFLQGGISSEDCEWFLTNCETGKRARFTDTFEIEEVEEATILDFPRPDKK